MYATMNVKRPVQRQSLLTHIDRNDGREVQVQVQLQVQLKTQNMNLFAGLTGVWERGGIAN